MGFVLVHVGDVRGSVTLRDFRTNTPLRTESCCYLAHTATSIGTLFSFILDVIKKVLDERPRRLLRVGPGTGVREAFPHLLRRRDPSGSDTLVVRAKMLDNA